MHDSHIDLMSAVLNEIGRENLVLKGGTALMFAYGLDRPSEDLDFDAARKPRDIETRIRSVAVPGITIDTLDKPKDTETVTRFILRYHLDDGEPKRLKIEISYRDPVDDVDIKVINGIRFASVSRILHQKLLAAHDGKNPRTKARDLYDLDFIARKHPKAVTEPLAERLADFASDPAILESRYREAFEQDNLIDADITTISLRLCDNAKMLYQPVNKNTQKHIGGR